MTNTPGGRKETAATAAGRRAGMLSKHMSSSASPRAAGAQLPKDAQALFAASGQDSPVRSESIGGARVLTLNRPKALNALNQEMVDLISPMLKSWETSKSCNVVILKGEGSRAFCSGGDVVALTEFAKNDETRQKAIDFFVSEYENDRFIAHMQKPVVTFMDGVTMGGGVGLSVHAPFRIATENTLFAMPETTIGLFPDVGANFFLSRLDGQLGAYLGLTSERLSGYGVYLAGIATHYVPSDRLDSLQERLANLQFPAECPSTSQAGQQLINACIEEFVGDGEAASAGVQSYELVGAKRLAIDACFAYSRAEEIVGALAQLEKAAEGGDMASWAKKTRETIEFRSPTSVKVALEGIRRGAKMDINEVFDLDMQIASVCCTPALAPDFVTGVACTLGAQRKEYKGKRPPWSPATLPEVTQQHVRDVFFSGMHGAETKLPALPEAGAGVGAGQKKQKGYMAYPHAALALPTEKQIGQVVKGEARNSGSFAVSRDEVLAHFEGEWNGKIGVRHKVEEVLDRRTRTQEDGTLKWR